MPKSILVDDVSGNLKKKFQV